MIRLHSLCILQGAGAAEDTFFKGKIFYNPPPPPHIIQNFWEPPSWPKEKIHNLEKQSVVDVDDDDDDDDDDNGNDDVVNADDDDDDGGGNEKGTESFGDNDEV